MARSRVRGSADRTASRAAAPAESADGWLSVDELAAAVRVGADIIRRHVADGAPVDDQGRLHVIQYAAWLNLHRR